MKRRCGVVSSLSRRCAKTIQRVCGRNYERTAANWGKVGLKSRAKPKRNEILAAHERQTDNLNKNAQKMIDRINSVALKRYTTE